MRMEWPDSEFVKLMDEIADENKKMFEAIIRSVWPKMRAKLACAIADCCGEPTCPHCHSYGVAVLKGDDPYKLWDDGGPHVN